MAARTDEFLFFKKLAMKRLCMDSYHAELFALALTCQCDNGGGDNGADLDEKVGVTSNDTNPSYLHNKINNCGAIDITVENPGGDESLCIAHADTSQVDNLDTFGAQVIDTIIFDGYGHVVSYTLRNIDITDVLSNSLAFQDTPTIDFTFSGGILTADVILSQEEDNDLEILADGLFHNNGSKNRLVRGGIVTWLQDYDFYISPAFYYIDGLPYNSPEAFITLSPSDPSLDRFDAIYVDSDQIVKVIEGDPSLTPSQPGLDLGLQIGLSNVFVEAGSTSPVRLQEECLYQENGEWTTSTNDSSIDPASVNTPCIGGVGVEATNAANGDYLLLSRGTTFSPTASYNVITFRLNPKLDWSTNPTIHSLKVRFKLAGVQVGSELTIAHGAYNLDVNNHTCQIISIPTIQFSIPVSLIVDEFEVRVFSTLGTFGWFLDGLCLQGGVFGVTESDDIHNQYFGPQPPRSDFWITNNGRADGWFTSPDILTGGAGSEKFGWGSSVIGTTGTAIGFLAQANGQEGATAVGNQAVANQGVAVGFGATSNRGVAVGGNQTASGGTAVGWGSLSSGVSGVAFGGGAVASNNSATAIGDSSSVSGAFSNSLGRGSIVAHTWSTAIGFNATTTADRQFVVGGYDLFSDYGANDFYFGSGVISKFEPLNRRFNITGANGTNMAAGNWIFASGKSTGSAVSGTFEWQTSDPTISGTTLQSLTTKMGLNSNTKGLYLDNIRFQTDEGTDIVATNNLTLGTGNTFTITGNTQVNAITNTNWQESAKITLHLTGTPTLKHNTVGGAGTTPLRLAGAIDFTISGYTVLLLELKDGFWNEVGRTVASSTGGGGGILSADSGLVLSTATNVQLGSSSVSGAPLLHDTFIDQAGFTFSMNSAGNTSFLLDIGGEYGIGDVDGANTGWSVVVDDTAHEAWLGDANGVSTGVAFYLSQADPTYQMYDNGGSYFFIGASNLGISPRLYQLGDIDSQNNGTFLSIDDSVQTWTATNIPSATTSNILYYDSVTGAVTHGTAPTSFPGISADNGLTENVANNIQLGGTLIQTTNISVNSQDFSFQGSGSNIIYFNDGGIDLTNNNNTIPLVIRSNASGNFPPIFISNKAGTTDTVSLLKLRRNTTGTAAAGLGGSIEFEMEDNIGTNVTANSIVSKLTSATSGAITGEFHIEGVNAGVNATLFTISGNGATRINKYGVGSFTSGTGTYLLATKSDGTIMEFPTGGLPGGGNLITADNGLTASTATNVQLGGTLLQNTTIATTASFKLVVSGSSSRVLEVTNSNNAGIPIYVSGQQSEAIHVESTGTQFLGRTTTALTNTQQSVYSIIHNSSGTAAASFGLTFDFSLGSATVADRLSNQFISKWTTATDATRTSQLDITGVNSASTATIMSAHGSGVVGIGIATGYTATRLQISESSTTGTETVKIAGVTTGATPVVRVDNNSSGHAILGVASGSGYGIYGTGFRGVYGSGTSFGVQGDTNSGTGVKGLASTGIAGHFITTPTTANDVTTVVQVAKLTSGNSGNGQNGIGGSLDFLLPTSTSAGTVSTTVGSIYTKLTDATHATRTTSMTFTGTLSAATVDLLTLAGDGSMKMRPITSTAASAITVAEGLFVFVSDTNGTFTSVGPWCYYNGAWHAL